MTILWSNYGGLWLYKKFANKGVDGAEYSSLYSWPHIVLATIQTGAACMLSILAISILAHFIPLRFEGSLEAGTSIFEWIVALIISIIMQYGNLRQRGVHSPIMAIDRAFRSEILSVTAWMGGFFLWRGFTNDIIYGNELIVETHWTYWFMEQIGMYIGLLVAVPINYLLIRKGIKKNM